MIDWIIRNSCDSYKLIVSFGGSAMVDIDSFVEAKGGKVGALNEKNMKNIQIAQTKLEYAGGNNEFPVLVDENGKDLYPQIMGRRMDYTDLAHQEAVLK